VCTRAQIMLNASIGEPLDRLVYLSNLQNNYECVAVDHAAMIADLSNTTADGNSGVSRFQLSAAAIISCVLTEGAAWLCRSHLVLPGESSAGRVPRADMPLCTDALRSLQTCSEFAFYQTCESGSQCPYTLDLNTLQYNLDQCQVWGSRQRLRRECAWCP
jgi:hypothetical protein